MDLSDKELTILTNLEKGYAGELLFDSWVEGLSNDWIILNDLLFESNNTEFQIDSLLISSESIYQFEVKNFDGDFYIEDDKWFSHSGKEINNPLLQLERSESLFRRLLLEFGVKTPIKSFVCFVNPEFHLFQAPRYQPIIFPTQLPRFIQKLQKNPPTIQKAPIKLAEKLVAAHLIESRHKRVYEYQFEELRKGIRCSKCNSFLENLKADLFICKICGETERVKSAILRNVDEFILLFPQKKITTGLIHEWCNGLKTERTIRRILLENHKLIGNRKNSYFIKP
ncbi:nuclease-related domain-containing protein [Bacillus sp. DTU_2020_1000418_1_SI_GHA_SEK_038]|uniref:nuclease-related domain-containing protein n=1 Tax=Bacillus sp. DTU_2020_1000418_1_SI_GHA_SEK_038 TaxID=3077585 RepID=UPI0028E64461|nr:nuclease-related domain-containing protein [Bacillus sp. DTU_2020_1000418_1_SI_GHA_SEK_038]WNS73723.1 nuclease-related domain-containing protein [Bacillus sp. DTU_2020_1000418_1_SI_GHA_SEK_038]